MRRATAKATSSVNARRPNAAPAVHSAVSRWPSASQLAYSTVSWRTSSRTGWAALTHASVSSLQPAATAGSRAWKAPLPRVSRMVPRSPSNAGSRWPLGMRSSAVWARSYSAVVASIVETMRRTLPWSMVPVAACASTPPTIGRSYTTASIASSIAMYVSSRWRSVESIVVASSSRATSRALSMYRWYASVAACSVIVPASTCSWSLSICARSASVADSARRTRTSRASTSMEASASARALRAASVCVAAGPRASRAPGTPREAAMLSERSAAKAEPAESWVARLATRSAVCAAVRADCSDVQVTHPEASARTRIGMARVRRIFPRTPSLRSMWLAFLYGPVSRTPGAIRAAEGRESLGSGCASGHDSGPGRWREIRPNPRKPARTGPRRGADPGRLQWRQPR